MAEISIIHPKLGSVTILFQYHNVSEVIYDIIDANDIAASIGKLQENINAEYNLCFILDGGFVINRVKYFLRVLATYAKGTYHFAFFNDYGKFTNDAWKKLNENTELKDM